MTTKVVPQPPKPATKNNKNVNTGNVIDQVSQSLGYLVMWTGSTKQGHNELMKKAIDSGLPSSITSNIQQHTVPASLGLAKNDSRWRKVLHNGYRVEVKELSRDETSGVTTMEFLGYELEDNGTTKKGKRTHFDKVAVDDNGDWIHKGTTEVAESFIKIVDDHRANLRGMDLYAMVTSPTLHLMRRVRIARNCYYVANTPENNKLINSLENLMTNVGFTLVCLTQANDKRTKDGLTDRVENDLNDRISDVVSKVSDWKSKNRVHGRSSKKVFEELAEILSDSQEMEKALTISLKAIQDQIEAVRSEADVIISNQAPTGVNDVTYDDFQKAVNDPSNVLQQTEAGKILMLKGDELSDHISKNGQSLKKGAIYALKSLGYYSYVAEGFVILRPIAELQSAAS